MESALARLLAAVAVAAANFRAVAVAQPTEPPQDVYTSARHGCDFASSSGVTVGPPPVGGGHRQPNAWHHKGPVSPWPPCGHGMVTGQDLMMRHVGSDVAENISPRSVVTRAAFTSVGYTIIASVGPPIAQDVLLLCS